MQILLLIPNFSGTLVIPKESPFFDYDGKELYKDEAIQLMIEWQTLVNGLMKKWNLQNEAELITGFTMDDKLIWNTIYKKDQLKKMIVEQYTEIMQSFRQKYIGIESENIV